MLQLLFTLFLLFFSICKQQTQKEKLLGVFDGRTPCTELATQIGQPYREECIKIKWRLTLYANDATSGGRYTLLGHTYKGSNTRTGTWTVLKGTADDPEAAVIRLSMAGDKYPLYLQKMDDNVLLFLDQQKKLMVGNLDFSYALNRKGAEN